MDSTDTTDSDTYTAQIQLQRKLYFLNEQLQAMARDLPPKYQQRIPNELLAALAESLLDETVFRIVNTLMDIQHVTEKQLMHQRLQLTYNQKIEVEEMILNNEGGKTMCNSESMEIKHKEALKEFDKKAIELLDDKLHDQQNFLEKAGVPGFEITDDPNKILIQIRLLDFIIRLSKMSLP